MTDMTSVGFAAVDLLTRRNPATIEKVTQINSYHVNQVAGCIEKLKAVSGRVTGSLLNTAMVVYRAGLICALIVGRRVAAVSGIERRRRCRTCSSR